jgi:hypothetical protein
MKALYITSLGLALTTSCDRPTTQEHAAVPSSGVDILTDDARSAQKRKVQNNTPGAIPALDSLEENYNTLTTDQFSDYIRTTIEQHGLSAISELAKKVSKEIKSTTLPDKVHVSAIAIAEFYLSSNSTQLSLVLDATAMGGVYNGLLAHAVANSLATADFPDKAYVDLLQNGPSKRVNAGHYPQIASKTGQRIGYRKALELIPNPRDGAFGATASNALFREWLSSEPEGASRYIMDLPAGLLKSSGVVHLTRWLADHGDFEAARAWAAQAGPDDSVRLGQYIELEAQKIKSESPVPQ